MKTRIIEFPGVEHTAGWFQEPGLAYDVVLSSRIRISRNLNRHRFPPLLQSDEESEVQSDILSAFQSTDSDTAYSTALMGDLAPLERRMLLERNYITQQFSLNNHKAIVMRKDDRMSCMINEIDHLRLSSIRGGLSLDDCWHTIDGVDSALEILLDYAVSLEWGYLSAEVANTGTALRASAMVHLPALVRTNLIEKAMKAVVQVGMTVKGFFSDDEHSLGDMYQISNQMGLGISEKELIEKLDAIISQLVHYERKARDQLLEEQKMDLEDEIMRAAGLLTHCRLLESKEAIRNLAILRLGAAVGLVSVPIERVTALLFLTQKAHIQFLIDSRETGADTSLIDYTRAELVRTALSQCL